MNQMNRNMNTFLFLYTSNIYLDAHINIYESVYNYIYVSNVFHLSDENKSIKQF